MVGLKCALTLLVIVVTTRIVTVYANYFPANFSADFLVGREATFYGLYQWGFYPHIVAGPFTLIAGLLLVSERFRIRFRLWHVRLGKAQVATVLFVLVPSGFLMAFYAQAGMGVKTGFATLALFTGFAAWKGWRLAVQRDFCGHQAWMRRCYALLCSAVVTRIFGGTFFILGVEAEWTYYLTAWASWLIPLLTLELLLHRRQWLQPTAKAE